MTISRMIKQLDLETIVQAGETIEIKNAFTSDLLSDVMANAPSDSVLITIQAHKNTVAVATLAGITAIIVCSGRPIPEDMIQAAGDEGIALLKTKNNQFQVSGGVYQELYG
ncbi:MAG: hypothetical protein K9L68_11845 [Spirochaetales bacterium]|nr:hypothetical protein [Spirochaetales bacterium]MCF7939282.1 hypothetical protein [Spirochaetales bacterium]